LRRRVLLDTGPLVAFLNRSDRHHAWALERLAEIEPPLLTCEAVLAEACHLVRRTSAGPRAVAEMVTGDLIEVPFRLGAEAERIGHLLGRYADVPMSLADACLVRLAEIETGSAVLTLDSDFHVYRMHGRQVIPLISP
jgi:predicted nucleic acid-binding protein